MTAARAIARSLRLRLQLRLRLISTLPLLLIATTASADPPGPVTACASDTQGNAGLNLAQALGFGGSIRFRCPAGTVIAISGRYVLNVPTLIDGADAVTLDARGGAGPFLNSSQNVVLRRLVLRGFAQPRQPSIGRITGSVLAARGDAELDRVTIEGSDFPVRIAGTGTVSQSNFVGNRGGLTLVVEGVAHIDHSRFTGNLRALQMAAGWVRSSSFNQQTGEALRVEPATGPVEIRHSTFSDNRSGTPLVLSQRAARGGPQTVSVRANMFRGNDGGNGAGAIGLVDVAQEARDRRAPPAVIAILAALPPASFVLGYNRFAGNRGRRGGALAADLANSGGMVSVGDLFVGNSAAAEGGAVAVTGGSLRISHALFKGNRAGAQGAAIAVAATASVSLANALVVGNAGPAGAVEGRAVTLANVTVADNLAVGLLLDGGAARAANVLLARNRPADCARVASGTFRGGALQSDGSCPGVASGDAFLDAFYVPAAGSPALTAGDVAICRGASVGGVDLPFQTRTNAAACALGAFERPPLDKLRPNDDRRLPHADAQDAFTDGYKPPPARTPASGASGATGAAGASGASGASSASSASGASGGSSAFGTSGAAGQGSPPMPSTATGGGPP